MAAELGYADKALAFFHRGLFVDLADMHGNTADGVHIASCGGVWTALTYGFGGLRDHEGEFTIDPRLPEGWEHLSYNVTIRDVQVRVTVRPGEVELVSVRGKDAGVVTVLGQEVRVACEPQVVVGETVLVAG